MPQLVENAPGGVVIQWAVDAIPQYIEEKRLVYAFKVNAIHSRSHLFPNMDRKLTTTHRYLSFQTDVIRGSLT